MHIIKHNAHPTQTAERVSDVLRQRGVAKTHPASEFGGANPPDELADDIGNLVDGRVRNIDEAGPVPGTGERLGNKKTPRGEPGSTRYESDVRENNAAEVLAAEGYVVKQIDEAQGSLDYEINGRLYDCYSPYHDARYSQEDNIAHLWEHVRKEKVGKGKTRVVLNLEAIPFSNDDVFAYFRANPIDNADDIIVVRNGQVLPFWDFLR